MKCSPSLDLHFQSSGEARAMIWEVCIQYPNGKERILCSYKHRETALKHIDAIYASGYPMHVAYIVRSAIQPFEMDTEFQPGEQLSHLQPA